MTYKQSHDEGVAHNVARSEPALMHDRFRLAPRGAVPPTAALFAVGLTRLAPGLFARDNFEILERLGRVTRKDWLSSAK